MPIEILANVTNAHTIGGIPVSDIAAIISSVIAFAALISSALIFWFGYSRTRKSEQIKITRDIVDRIDIRFQNVFNTPVTETELEIFILCENIKYFGSLVKNHEIGDKNILNYYIPLMNSRLTQVEKHLYSLEGKMEDVTRKATLNHIRGAQDEMRLADIEFKKGR